MLNVRIHLTDGSEYKDKIYGDPVEIGGEGRIYRYYHAQFGDCRIKLYQNQSKAKKRQYKILYFLSHKAPVIHPKIQYCWPIAAIYDINGINFLGYLMKATPHNSRDLTILTNYKIGSSIRQDYPNERKWYEDGKYELQTQKGLRNRITMLINWAVAIRGIHRTGKYCIGDIKPENVFATPDGCISIIDIDSMQINDGKIFCKVSAVTPEYFSPEGYALKTSGERITKRCDSFSFGCCAYMVLTGTHPYNNIKLKYPYNTDEYNTIAACIKAGLYLRGENAKYIEKVTPEYDLQSNFDKLPICIQGILNRAFGKESTRPSFDEWVKTLKQGKEQI